MSTLTIDLGERSYPMHVVEGGFDGLAEVWLARGLSRRCIIISDDNVAPRWADDLKRELGSGDIEATLVVMPHGEASKTVETWQGVLHELLSFGIDRQTPVVALGGGVVGDVAGFAAATALRGVPFVQVPTTVLAMVDSSVGGKTGVNAPYGKNLIGAFHQPSLVWAGIETLSTLDDRERRAGLGEVVKAALLGASDVVRMLDGTEDWLAPSVLKRAVLASAALKADIVAEDEREAGRRVVLNLGHTIAHGLEVALGYGILRHGEAVGLGLLAETRWAHREGLLRDDALVERLFRWLRGVGLPVTPPRFDPRDVLSAMKLDKKASHGRVKVPYVRAIGDVGFADLSTAKLEGLIEGLS